MKNIKPGQLPTKLLRQALRFHIVVTMERGKAVNTGWDSYRGESRMASCRIRTAMIHGRADRYSRRHLVIQQTADAVAQSWLDGLVFVVILARGVGVDCACQI